MAFTGTGCDSPAPNFDKKSLTAASGKPIDPDTKQLMNGYYVFMIPFRVVLRNPGQ